MDKLSLKKAIEQHKLAEFIEQNKDIVGDKEKLDKVISQMTNSSKSVRQTSTEDSSEN